MKKKVLVIFLFFVLLIFPGKALAEENCRYKLELGNSIDYITFYYEKGVGFNNKFYVDSVDKYYSINNVIASADGYIFNNKSLYLDYLETFQNIFTSSITTCPSSLPFFAFGTTSGALGDGYILANSNYNSSLFALSNGTISLSQPASGGNNTTTPTNICGVPSSSYCGSSYVIPANALGAASSFKVRSMEVQFFTENNKKMVAITVRKGNDTDECRTYELNSEVGNIIDVDYYSRLYGTSIYRIQTFNTCSNLKVNTCEVDDGEGNKKIFIGENCNSSVGGNEETITTPETTEEYIENYTPTLETTSFEFCDPTIGENGVENGTLRALRIVGIVIYIAKILTPLVLIILGSIDLAKAAVSGDDKATSEALQTTLRRLIIGIVIFFVPTIAKLLISMVSDADNLMNNKYVYCTNCLLDPFGDCIVSDK